MSFLKDLFSSNKQEFEKAEVLLDERSPSCPIVAVVEQDSRVAYFYLWGPEGSQHGVKSCWIRNLQEAPEKFDKDLMDNGIPPMMPREFCKYPEGQEKLKAEELEIVWTEEGDAAALLVKGEIVSIIPVWGGRGEFFGYARDCQGEGNVAWELSKSNEYIDRIRQSQSYHKEWNNDDSNPFGIQQPIMIDKYIETFGKDDQYYAIDGGAWPPVGLYLRDGERRSVFATVGVSLLPMPMVEMYYENRFEANRIELGMMLDAGLSEDQLEKVAGQISGAVAIPWENITFLGEGHTLNFEAFEGSKFNSVVLTSELDLLPQPELGEYRGSEIKFLWMIPISERERQEIVKNRSQGVLEKLNKLGDKVFSLDREEVV